MKTWIKIFVNLVFGVFGYEVRILSKRNNHNISNIRVSMSEALELLVGLDFSPSTVIDVGVGYGTTALYSQFPKAKHLLIEPLEEFENELQKICKRYEAEYILAAAGADSGYQEISVGQHLEGSSLLWQGGKRREVPIVTLDEVCRQRSCVGPYVLKVDVQGAELEVLNGARGILKETEVVILEVSFFHFADGVPDFYDVIYYMKEKGFVVYDLFDGHNRPLDGARAQIDIAFVKEDGRFRQSHAWATKEQIAEFHNQFF